MRFVTENPQAFTRQLINARNTILSRLGEMREEAENPEAGAEGLDRLSQETLNLLDSKERHELEKINAALERIKRGEFGKCLSCGEDIPVDQLKSIPTSTQCVECAQKNH